MNILQKIVHVSDDPIELIEGSISVFEATELMKEGGYIMIGDIPLSMALDADQYDVVLMSTELGSSEIKEMKNVMSISHDDSRLALVLLSTGHGKIQIVTDNAEGVSLYNTLKKTATTRGVDVSLIDMRLRIVHEPLDSQALIVSNVRHSDVAYPTGANVIVRYQNLENGPQGLMSLVPSPIEWSVWERPDQSLPVMPLIASAPELYDLTPRQLIDKDMTIFIDLLKKLQTISNLVLSRDDLINLWNQFVIDSRYSKSFSIKRFVSPTTHLPLFDSYDLMTNTPLSIDDAFIYMFQDQNKNQLFDGGQTLLRYKFMDSVFNNMKIVLMTLHNSPENGILRYTSSYSLIHADTLVTGMEALNNTIGPNVEAVSATLTHVN